MQMHPVTLPTAATMLFSRRKQEWGSEGTEHEVGGGVTP